MNIKYLYSKFFKIVVRGKSILNSKVNKTAKIYSGTTFYESSIGRYSYVGYDSEIFNCDIGAFCSIANNAIIGAAYHPTDYVTTSPVFFNTKGGPNGKKLGNLPAPPHKRTVIGNDVWIGSRAIIIQGCKIGDGAVIGAGAIVTKDVPPYAIVGGVPARILKYRFDNHKIEKLIELRWWDLDETELMTLSELIPDVNAYLNKLHINNLGGG